MPYVRVDRHGRMVLPKEARRALGIDENSSLVYRIVGNKIVLEKFSAERLNETFARLEEIAPSLDTDMVVSTGGDKYVDREYALRKIGLRRNS
ncbi:MAG: AbrB/MazE/SpoVT family DNA-binding domain-containing protein [Nitrososphaerales archaeon]